MQINLSTQPPDLQKHKCLVLGFFSDEKPPRGTCGVIDWRLNGMISQHIKMKHITGEFKEKVAIPWPDPVRSELVVLVGMGDLADHSYDRAYNAAHDIGGMMDKMKVREFAFDLPGLERTMLTTAGLVEAMITGFFDYYSEDISKLSVAKLCLVVSENDLKSVAQGITQFHKNVRHLGSVDFSALEPHFA